MYMWGLFLLSPNEGCTDDLNMPLLNKKEVPPGPRVPPTGGKEVFVVRCTGECIEKYEDYIAKLNQYALPQYSEKYYNKSGLTYEEALAIERNVEDQIRKQFPKELEGRVLRQIHHSTLRKEELINTIYESLKAPSPGADKENGQLGSPASPSSSQAAHAVTKKLLMQFLIYVADKLKPGIWVCKDPWVQKYRLPADVPDGFAQAEPSSPAPGSAKVSAAAGDATPMKTPMRSKVKGADSQPGPVRTMQEEEAKLKPGSIKAIAFQVMKERGAAQPVSVDDIIRITTTDGTCIDWPDSRKRTLSNVLSTDTAFARLARGQYTLRALAGDVPILSPFGSGQAASGAAQSGAERSGGAKDVMAAAFGAASGGSIDAQKQAKQSKDAAAEGDEQLSGLARAEKLLAQAQKAVAARQADADAANAAIEACKQRLAAAKQSKAVKRESGANEATANGGSKPAVDLDAMFALPAHLKEYTGDANDRKAKSAWRHERSNEEKRLKKEREAYVQQQRLESAKKANSDVQSLQAAYDRAKKAADDAASKLERAKKAESDASRGVEREKQREMLKDIKEKSKADKEKQKQAEKEERERRRQEALAAKRYPIDDLELLTEELTAAVAAAATSNAAEAGPSASAANAADGSGSLKPAALLPAEQLDVPHLSQAKQLSPVQSLELGQLLYVADTLSQFSRQLGVKGCSHAELQSMLDAAAAAHAGGAVTDEKQREALKWLGHVYQQLLKVLVEDIVQLDGAARVFNRWSEVLECGAAAWPELVRRWILVQQLDGLASPEGVAVAQFLSEHEASELSPQQHLVLLTQLLDDCLDTSLIRDMLSNRIEEAQECAAAVRAELQEGRKKLRELLDAEKESRKRKRAAALALATAAAERQLKEKGLLPGTDTAAAAAEADSAGAAASGAAAAEAAGASGGPASAEDQVAKKIKATTKEILERVAGPGISGVTLAELEAELAADMEEEPNWELPPHLQQYSGPSGDKKAMSEFRRKQQEARKQLEKQQARWQADKAKRDKAKAEAKRKEVDAERKLQLERQRAEEALAEQQDRLEQQLEKYLVRRQPLGNDRYNRVYWWGLAGNKEGLLVQQEVGCAETTLELLHEVAVAAAPQQQQHKADPAAADDGEASAAEQQLDQNGGMQATEREDGKQQQGGSNSRRASVSEARVDKELIAPLNHKGLLLPFGPEGWAVIDDVNVLESLANGLEQRGIREKELKATLEKMMPSISAAIAKAAAAQAAAAAAKEGSSKKDKSKRDRDLAVVPRELPSRHARSAAAEQIKKTGSAAASKAKEELTPAPADEEDDDKTGLIRGWARAALKSAVANLQELSVTAAAAKAAVPTTGDTWAKYRTHLDELLQGDLPESWAEDTAAAAAVVVTGAAVADASAACAKDAAWSKAVLAASQAAAAAADAPPEHQQQAVAAAVQGQLRLQLLQFEQQLVTVTGECPYLYKDSALAGIEDGDADDESEPGSEEGEGEADGPQDSEQQQPVHEQAAMEADDDAQEVAQQQKRGRGRPTKAAAPAAAVSADSGDKARGRGTKRSAAAASSGSGQAVADIADAVEADAEGGAAPAAKRRKHAGAAAVAGLPPRPDAARAARAKAAAAAGDAEAVDGQQQQQHSPVSREGSVAPASSSAAAAGDKGASKHKRGRSAAAAGGSSRATSQEPEQQTDADVDGQQQQRPGKKQARSSRASKGSKKAAAADATEQDDGAARSSRAVGFDVASEDDESMDVDDDHDDARRRHSLPHKHSHEHQDGDNATEEVTEEADSVIPMRLSGRTVWRSGEERDSWRNSVAAANTAACLAYCAAALVFHAQQPLEKLAATAAKMGKKAGGRK